MSVEGVKPLQLLRCMRIALVSLIAIAPVSTAFLAVTPDAAVAASRTTAYAWGYNGYGELGNGTYNTNVVPGAIQMPTGVKFSAIAAGNGHSLALDAGGAAFAWGDNSHGELGNGKKSGKLVPVSVRMPHGIRFKSVAAGEDDSLALATNGAAYAWGYNYYGQLGIGSRTDRDTPGLVRAPAGVKFIAIAAGNSHSLALAASGAVYAWGDDTYGQLGNGTTSVLGYPIPVEINMPIGVVFTAIAAGAWHSLALATNGTVYSWGRNQYGELGNATTTDSDTPIAVSLPTGATAKAIGAGAFHSLALTSNGAAFAWGYNGDGELGDGTFTDSDIPTAVSMPSGVIFTTVVAGGFHNLALDSNGAGYAWGFNSQSQLGTGTTMDSDTPVAVVMPAGVAFSAIAAGSVDSLALAR